MSRLKNIDKGLRLEKHNDKWRIVEFSYVSGKILKIIKKQDKNWDYRSLTFYLQGAEEVRQENIR